MTSVKAKLMSLALVGLVLMVALWKVSAVVDDRQNYRQQAIASVAHSLAGPQTLTGPLLHRACTEEWDVPISGKKFSTERREWMLKTAPAVLKVSGTSQLEERARGLHATQAFTLKARLVVEWPDLMALQPVAEHKNGRVNCGQPLLMLAVSDARGIRHAAAVVAGQSLTPKPGTLLGSHTRGVHVPLALTTPLSEPFQADITLELVGTEQLAIVPMGGDTQVSLTSNWPHPSFGGQFLPAEKKVTDHGFEAHWRVSALASTAQQAVVVGEKAVDALNITFIDPGNTYALSDKATKYGLLFIGLTFLAVGLFEFMQRLRVHPVQYALVGAAMVLFFLLLVSLSEHLPFGAAYALASGGCVLLLTVYACYMLHSWARGVPFGLGIAALHGMLFVLLQMEQTALLVGAVALFVVLAAVMGMTRRVDWYARLAVPPTAVNAPQTEA
ncbi:MAG: cell envelope integrity protein CreD [Polaromonas sp.]